MANLRHQPPGQCQNETNEPAGTQSTGGLCHATHETSDKHDVACDPVFPFDVLALRGPSETTTSHTEGHQSWWFLLSDRKQQTAMPRHAQTGHTWHKFALSGTFSETT